MAAIIQSILINATNTTKNQIEALISGECIEKVLIPELTYTDLENKDEEIRQKAPGLQNLMRNRVLDLRIL